MNKTCSKCKTDFEVASEDLGFYDKISPLIGKNKIQIPSPTHCPNCRMQRRLSFLNIRNLYKTKDKDGKTLISPYSEDKGFNLMNLTDWYSDKKEDVEMDLDLEQNFFKQFKQLQIKAPRWTRIIANCENCDWCINTTYSKSCYIIRSSMYAEDCYYSERIINCKNVSDCTIVDKSQRSYEIIDGENLFEVFFGQEVKNCQDSIFLYDCENVSQCIGCVGLRYKNLHILNRPCTETKFLEAKKRILTDGKFKNEMQKNFEDLKLKVPRRANTLIQSENCSGNEIVNCKNTKYSFSVKECEDCKFLDFGSRTTDSYDFSQPDIVELCYECGSSYKIYNCLFCFNSIELKNCIYCETCANLEDCFGCVGLYRKKYCILNKQYTKEAYEELIPKIIEKLKNEKLWGEFFPIENSSYLYEESIAHEYFPRENTHQGQNPKAKDQTKPKDQNLNIPDNIEDVDDSICEQVLTCLVSGKSYKIIPQELKFYRELGLPIPRTHPDMRHKIRMELRLPRKIYQRNCLKCGAEVKTPYAPERNETIYCRECYLSVTY